MSLAQQEWIVSRHMVDATSEQIAAFIALCRHAWPRSANIPEGQELPFDGKTGEILDNLQKIRKYARSYSSQYYYHQPRQP